MVGAVVAHVIVVDPLPGPQIETSPLVGRDDNHRTRTHDLGRGDPLLDIRYSISDSFLTFCSRVFSVLFTF